MKTETTTTKPAFDPEVPPREGFIFYRTFYEALASMKNRARLHLYDVIMRDMLSTARNRRISTESRCEPSY